MFGKAPRAGIFDPFRAAQAHGITVREADLVTATAAWLPEAHMIVVAAGLDYAMTRYAIAHQLMHAELDRVVDSVEHSNLRQLDPARYAHETERVVHTMTARRLIPADQLDHALRQSDDAEQVADELDVPVECLARRTQELTPIESAGIERLITRLSWPALGVRLSCARVTESELAPRAGRHLEVIHHQSPRLGA